MAPIKKTGKKLAGRRHVHGCRRCHIRYEDACHTPETDGLCTECRGGRPWVLLIENAAPKDCCREISRLATKDDRETYKLAGSHLWWICRSCKRTHPVNPAHQNNDEKDTP